MKKMAHIKNGLVVNVSLWDGESEWSPMEEVVEIPQDQLAGIGWTYSGGQFINPAESE